MPFILFLYENPEIQIKINEIINKLNKIDNRFILYNKYSEKELESIKKIFIELLVITTNVGIFLI